MRPPKTILVATDFSPLSEVGLEVALTLAKRTGARVHVVHVLEPEVPVYPYNFPARQLQEIQKEREAKASSKLEQLGAKDVVVTRELRVGIPSRELVVAAERSGADLVVIASHGYGPIGRAVIGSVAASMIRTSQVPVLVVGERRRNLEFRTVVAGVDLSPITRQVLDLARTYAAPDGMVEAVSFYEPPIVMADDLLPYYPSNADVDRLREDRAASIRAMIPKDEGPTVNVAAVAKAPAAVGILETAELLHADLVVVGTSGHNFWHRAFIGSTATRVLSEASCPVLVVPCKPS